MTDDDVRLERFARAAERARDEPLPTLDVTDAVLARIAAERPPALDLADRTTRLCLAASLLVALSAAWVGAEAFAALTDPLGELVVAMTTEVP